MCVFVCVEVGQAENRRRVPFPPFLADGTGLSFHDFSVVAMQPKADVSS